MNVKIEFGTGHYIEPRPHVTHLPDYLFCRAWSVSGGIHSFEHRIAADEPLSWHSFWSLVGKACAGLSQYVVSGERNVLGRTLPVSLESTTLAGNAQEAIYASALLEQNPAEIMRDLATQMCEGTPLEVDHASFDAAAAYCDAPATVEQGAPTPTPWRVNPAYLVWCLAGGFSEAPPAILAGDEPVVGCSEWLQLTPADAERIVACVNACGGIPTAALVDAHGGPGFFGRMASKAMNERDLAMSSVKSITADRDMFQEAWETAYRAIRKADADRYWRNGMSGMTNAAATIEGVAKERDALLEAALGLEIRDTHYESEGCVWILLRSDGMAIGAGSIRVDGEFAKALSRYETKRRLAVEAART